MRVVLGVILCFLLAASALALPVDKVILDDYVKDYVDIISPEDEGHIRAMANALNVHGKAELAVVIVDNFDGLTREQYALEIAHENLGDTENDNGLLILIGMEEREYRVEVGYGLEGDLNDAKIGRFARDTLIPAFQEGEYGLGVVLLVQAIQNELLEEGQQAIIPVQQPSRTRGYSSQISWLVFMTIFFVLRGLSAARYAKKHNKHPDGRDVDNAFTAAMIASMFMRGGRGGFGGGGMGGFGGFGGGGFGGGGAGGGW